MARRSRGLGLFERRGGYMPDEEFPPEQIPTDIYAPPPPEESPASPAPPDEDEESAPRAVQRRASLDVRQARLSGPMALAV